MAMNGNGNNGNSNNNNGVNARPIYAGNRWECTEGVGAAALSVKPNGYIVEVAISPMTGSNNGKPIYDYKNAKRAFINQKNVPTLIAAATGVRDGVLEGNYGTSCANKGTETLISVGRGKDFPNEPGVTEKEDAIFLRIADFDGNNGKAFYQFGEAPDMVANADPHTGKFSKTPVSAVPGFEGHGINSFIQQLEEQQRMSYGVQSSVFSWDFRYLDNDIKNIGEKVGIPTGGNSNGGRKGPSMFDGAGSDGYTSNYTSSSLDMDDM